MMTETQRAAMQAAHDAIAIAQNNLAPSRESAIAFDDGDLWDQYQRAMDGITAALAEPGPADEPFAYLLAGGMWGDELQDWEIDPVQSSCNKINEAAYADGKELKLPLYTRPQRREPLTDERIHNLDPLPHVMFDAHRIEFARAIESAHGIGEKP